MTLSQLTVVRLYHDLLGTYGDAGNAEVLIHRATARGIQVELIDVQPGQSVPTDGHIYLIGGGEDGPQTAALHLLKSDGGLNRAVNAGASVLAVCAGFQLIGTSLPAAGTGEIAGLGLIDARTFYPESPRSVGEVATICADPQLGLPLLTGFENHQGFTQLGDGVSPLGWVQVGVGNGCGAHKGESSTNQSTGETRNAEGALVGNIFGTYLHGSVLARNPELADAILETQAGVLEAFTDEFAEQFARERRLAVQ